MEWLVVKSQLIKIGPDDKQCSMQDDSDETEKLTNCIK
jgi:hypothetical protein